MTFIYETYYLNIISLIVCFSFILFFLILFSFFVNSHNIILLLILNELMVFFIMLIFLCFGFLFDDLIPQVFVLFLLIITSCEVVIAFSLFIVFKSSFKTLNVSKCYYNK